MLDYRGYHATRTLYSKQLDGEMEQINKDVDSMSEMGKMESLCLQMMMDRLSTLSNIMKKIAHTDSQIVQNLK